MVCPGGHIWVQFRMLTLPGEDKRPPGHGEQVSLDAAPTVGEYVPSSHGWHEDRLLAAIL